MAGHDSGFDSEGVAVTPEDLRETVDLLRRAGRDTASVEVKSGAGGVGKSLWPTISAFSNAKGGLVISASTSRQGSHRFLGSIRRRQWTRWRTRLALGEEVSRPVR